MAKFNNPTKVITGVNTRWSYVNAWAIIVLDIWAIGSMITHFIMWMYKGNKKLSKKKNRE